MDSDAYWSDDSEDYDPLFWSPRPVTDDEIKALLDLFVAGNLTNAEAEAALERLSRAKKRVWPFVFQLCRSTDRALHQTGAILVRELNLTAAREPLRALIQDPGIEDDQKLRLLTALQAVGGIRPGEDPLVYLRDPRAVMRKTRETFIAALNDPFQLSEIIEDGLAAGDQSLLDPATLRKMSAARDRGLMPLFLCMLHMPDDARVVSAIEALAAIGDTTTLAILEERAEWDAAGKVRRAARRAATELAASLAEAAPTILELPVAPPAVERCLLSTIDGTGGQIASILRRSPDGERLFFTVMFDDQMGIKDCFGGRGQTVATLEDELLDNGEEQGFEVVDVTLSQVRAELERAYQTTLTARRRLPPTYLAWRGWLCGDDDRPLEFYPLPSLSPTEMARLLSRCPELLDLPEFVSWRFEFHKLRSYERRFRKLLDRPGTDDAIEAVIDEAVAQHSEPGWCALIKDRLERQAWLLAQIYEEEDIPRLALTAAHGLAPASGVRPTDHPLLREMMRRTLYDPPSHS